VAVDTQGPECPEKAKVPIVASTNLLGGFYGLKGKVVDYLKPVLIKNKAFCGAAHHIPLNLDTGTRYNVSIY